MGMNSNKGKRSSRGRRFKNTPTTSVGRVLKTARKNKGSQTQEKIAFNVEHLDPLGQGVSKKENSITFIAKTLPGETGVGRIYKKSKGVQFARLESLETIAENRIEAECEHFDSCPGCHYLHTDYLSELAFKQSALIKILSPLLDATSFDKESVKSIEAPHRLGYRNRIQLHYRHQYIGLLDPVNDRIVEISKCKIIRDELRDTLDQLYADKSWASHHSGRGHCEIYFNQDENFDDDKVIFTKPSQVDASCAGSSEVKLTWNDSYAQGGFTQVNAEMNKKLKCLVTDAVTMRAKAPKSLLDLFSGSGNLSNAILDDAAKKGVPLQRTLVDFNLTEADNAFSLDLFSDAALKTFRRRLPKSQYDTFLVDPPRKGFPALNAWVRVFRPKQLVYVSCNAATLARDLQSIDVKFKLQSVTLLDLFPSTYHYETVAVLTF